MKSNEFVGYEKIIINENTSATEDIKVAEKKDLKELSISELNEFIINKSVKFINECVEEYLKNENFIFEEKDILDIKNKLLGETVGS
jgi:hypothetical protein